MPDPVALLQLGIQIVDLLRARSERENAGIETERFRSTVQALRALYFDPDFLKRVQEGRGSEEAGMRLLSEAGQSLWSNRDRVEQHISLLERQDIEMHLPMRQFRLLQDITREKRSVREELAEAIFRRASDDGTFDLVISKIEELNDKIEELEDRLYSHRA